MCIPSEALSAEPRDLLLEGPVHPTTPLIHEPVSYPQIIKNDFQVENEHQDKENSGTNHQADFQCIPQPVLLVRQS